MDSLSKNQARRKIADLTHNTTILRRRIIANYDIWKVTPEGHPVKEKYRKFIDDDLVMFQALMVAIPCYATLIEDDEDGA